MNLKNKKIFITGGTSGLGLLLVMNFLKSGAEVFTIGTKELSLTNLKLINSRRLHFYKCDIRDYSQLQRIISKIKSIDILINNAGVWIEGDILENTFEDINKAIDINLKGSIYATKAILRRIKKNKNGKIINILSTSALKGREDHPVYSASKYGLKGFFESLKINLKQKGINVINVYPGRMKTDIFQKAGYQYNLKEAIDPKEVVDTIQFIIDHDRTLIIDDIILNRK